MKSEPFINIIVPVFNEEATIHRSVNVLVSFLKENAFPYPYAVTIVDNGSTDNTVALSSELSAKYAEVSLLSLSQKGKGVAIREGWKQSGDIMVFMDADLSTDLRHLTALVDSIVIENADLAIGSRLGKDSHISGRRLSRELISRGYNFLVRSVFGSALKDHQCGFKAIRKNAYETIAPHLVDTGWFFDTELLILAMHHGFTVKSIDVTWRDNRDSKVSMVRTSGDMCKALFMFKRRLLQIKSQASSANQAI